MIIQNIEALCYLNQPANKAQKYFLWFPFISFKNNKETSLIFFNIIRTVMVLKLLTVALSEHKDLYIIHIETSRNGGTVLGWLTAQTAQWSLLCTIETHFSVNKSVEFCKRY